MLLGSIDILMSKNIRYKINIAGFLIKRCAICTSQLVRRDLFGSCDLSGIFFHQILDSLDTDPATLGRIEAVSYTHLDVYKRQVNIGISVNKLLAKMASDFEKPDKVHTLFTEEIPVKMWPLPVRDLRVLGKSSEKKLKEAGIRTIGDLAHEKKPKIQALLGEKAGQQLYRYARGLDDSPVKMKPDEAKGFSLETTFNDDLVSMEQALPILLEQCDVLAARMRRKKKKCTCISVTSVSYTHLLILNVQEVSIL